MAGPASAICRITLSTAETGAVLLPVSMATSQELIASMIAIVGRLNIQTERPIGRMCAASAAHAPAHEVTSGVKSSSW
jgi:hypothetical protein